MAMAQNVFTRLKLYKEAVECLLKQGRVRAGLDLARQRCPFSREDYIHLLRMCPSLQFLHALVERDKKAERPLAVGCVIMTLMEENKFELALQFIQEMQNKPSKGERHIHEYIRDLY